MITVPILSLLFGALLAWGAVASALYAWFVYAFAGLRWQVAVLVALSVACSFSLGVMLGLPLPQINIEWR